MPSAETEKETRREALRQALKVVRGLEDRLGEVTDPNEQSSLMELIEGWMTSEELDNVIEITYTLMRRQ